MKTALLLAPDPGPITSGGHRYNARLVEAAPDHGYTMRLETVRLSGSVSSADVVIVDSLWAWRALPTVRRADGPTIGLVHQRPGGADGGALRRSLQRPLDVRTYRACDLVIATSSAVADELVSSGLDRGRIVLVRPGCDLPPGEAVPPLRGGRRLGVLNVANWLPNKGITELLDAVAALPPDDVTLHLAGHTDVAPRYADEVAARLSTPELQGRVVVHGPLPPAAVASLYAAADVFVLPSHQESYGTVAAEALASGLPVVGWGAPHLRALVTHERDGLLIPSRRVDALADAIHRVATDGQLRERLGRGATQTGATLPRWTDTIEECFSAFDRAVAMRAAHS
jgi:glycosyltransferase involved in cell wall biosynthesis